MSSHRKRKQHTHRGSPDYNIETGQIPSQSATTSNIPFVQAHEAAIVRNRPDLVEALTMHDHGNGQGGLIQWHGDGPEPEVEVWVDRYDARLLLTSLPGVKAHRDAKALADPPSPTGWSDLPSDSEDTFFFTPAEIEEYHSAKRRKLADAGRQERLRALRKADPDPVLDFEQDREQWGDDDEEPDVAQSTLMERTARHLLTSLNPAQLEMRILANHGAHQRFAFLRGRWRNAWEQIKLASRAEEDNLEKEKSLPGKSEGASVLQGNLVAYGSDSDGSSPELQPERPEPSKTEGEREKAERRNRAREWTKRKRAIASINENA
ncbi:hypothetical protein BU17DRAFT_98632 [Hysterangium stoloniferum]|nr:hypothetical protein BU17DRAFT_98632 [Hysterangium stoloniferum]